jgi:hypothetical protein
MKTVIGRSLADASFCGSADACVMRGSTRRRLNGERERTAVDGDEACIGIVRAVRGEARFACRAERRQGDREEHRVLRQMGSHFGTSLLAA